MHCDLGPHGLLAHAGCRRLAARGRDETSELGQAAREEGSLAVVPGALAVADPRRQGDHILGRTAQLDAHDVGARVEAEGGCGDGLLQRERRGGVGAGHDGRGGQPPGYLFRVGGTRLMLIMTDTSTELESLE